MKKIIGSVSLLLIVVVLAGCFGNFQLTRNLYTWNSQVGSKFANTAVMWVMLIIPVYSVCSFIDFAILNVVEFWTGENPLAMSEGQIDIRLLEQDGKVYEIRASRNRFDITQLEGENADESVAVIYDPADGSWYLKSASQIQKIAELNGGLLDLYYPDGKTYQANLWLN